MRIAVARIVGATQLGGRLSGHAEPVAITGSTLTMTLSPRSVTRKESLSHDGRAKTLARI